MAFRLDYYNYDRKRVGYFVYATGIDSYGNERMVILSHDPIVSGCNPYYWAVTHNNDLGHEFSNQEDAADTVKYVSGRNYSVQSVDRNSIKIGMVEFNTISIATDLGDLPL